MTVNEMEFCEEISQDKTSDSELDLFEEESSLIDEILSLPIKKLGNLSGITTSRKGTELAANTTFISKPVVQLVSNIFKSPVSEETLRNNLNLSAPKIPFLNIRPADPWLKSLNPNLVTECLDSELFTHKHVSNFLRVAFPLVGLLDTMSKGRLTQSRVETAITDSLLLLSSAIENVNGWRRENLMRMYNLNHLKKPDVSPADNPHLFSTNFEKCAKFPSVDELYADNDPLPDLEIKPVSKFSNEIIAGDSILDDVSSKVHKLVSEDTNRQNGTKNAFTQTSDYSKATTSVGSEIKTCKCSVIDSPDSAPVAPVKEFADSSVKTAEASYCVDKSSDVSTKSQKSLIHLSPGAAKENTGSVGKAESEGISGSDLLISELTTSRPVSPRSRNRKSTGNLKKQDNLEKDFSSVFDVKESAQNVCDDSVDGSISSGITIEEDEDCGDNSSENNGKSSEMDSDLALTEVSDDKKSLPEVAKVGVASSSKRKFVPITGPPKATSTSIANSKTDSQKMNLGNLNKAPFPGVTSNPPFGTNKTSTFSSNSNKTSNTTSGTATNHNVKRIISAAPLKQVAVSNRNANAFHNAATIAGVGSLQQPNFQPPLGNSRLVRAPVDARSPISQMHNIPAKRQRSEPYWSAMDFSSPQQTGVLGVTLPHQQMSRDANFPRTNKWR